MTDPQPDETIRFRLKGPLNGLLFVRRPIHLLPEEGTSGFVNNSHRQCPAQFKGGGWQDLRGRPIGWSPTHWTVIDGDQL